MQRLLSILPAWALAVLRRLRALLRRAAELRHETPRARRAAGREEVEVLAARPTISLVLPTYKSDLRYLREAIDSVRGQYYPEWQLCIVDDGSGQPELSALLESYAASEPRIEFRGLEQNGGISAASNAGLEMCSGEFVGFLDHDDTLTEDALLRVAQVLSADPELDVVYSDSDKLTIKNLRADPFLKPDWSPTYALGAMYIGHLLIVRRSLAEAAGGFDSAFDTIQDFEFMLRVSERTDRIHHIPQILYHWRAIPGSIAAGTDQKDGVEELQPAAVSAHLERIGAGARAVAHPAIPHRAELAPPPGGAPTPAVTIVISGGEERQANVLRELGSYPALEVRVEARAAGESRGAANNRGAAAAAGEYLLFLGAETEVREADWVERLLLHATLPGVAAAGPMLVRPEGKVEQAGFAIGLRDPVAPMLSGLGAEEDGYYAALCCARDVSALSAECMLVRRDAFEAAGGFDENYASEYEDFDLCLKLARQGQRCVYAPRPRVVSLRSEASRRAATDIVDRALFVDNWYDQLNAGDPYYNPGFARQRADFTPSGWRERVYRATASVIP